MSRNVGRVVRSATRMLLCFLAWGCSKDDRTEPRAPEAPMTISLSSPAFPANGSIPAVHTCDRRDLSPPLAWSGIPAGTRSLALIVDDPDAPDPKAPKMTWVHWVVYNLPPSTKSLAEGASNSLPPGTLQGSNDWKRTGYRHVVGLRFGSALAATPRLAIRFTGAVAEERRETGWLTDDEHVCIHVGIKGKHSKTTSSSTPSFHALGRIHQSRK